MYGKTAALGSLNSLLSHAPQLSGANHVSLLTLLLARLLVHQLLSNHCEGWRHLLDHSLGSPHSHLEARNRWWLWHFLFIDVAGDIFISQAWGFPSSLDVLQDKILPKHWCSGCQSFKEAEKRMFPVLFVCYLFYWSIIDLQCCVNFCSKANWFSDLYMYVCMCVYIYIRSV